MITCQLIGGLGNQLFQIAATVALAIEHQDEAVFDLHAHQQLSQGSRAIDYRSTIYRKLNCQTDVPYADIYQELGFGYRPIEYRPGLKLSGWFQSERYFSDCRRAILDLFQPEASITAELKCKYASVLSSPNCAIHVRRGDYLGRQRLSPVLPVEYYDRAISSFDPSTTFLICSDDIDWCRQTFKSKHRFVFSDGNSDETDLYLMSMCEHQIIANSTFSWWAAWLNQNARKLVVAPQTWFGAAINYANAHEIYAAGMILV